MTKTHPGEANPLLEPWTGPFEAPPFGLIRSDEFRPAFNRALAEARAETDAVAANPEPPTFANTIEAIERSGKNLDKVASVFFNLVGTDSDETLEAVERDMAPILSRHRSAFFLNEALFARVAALHAQRDSLGLDAEQARVLERYHLNFTRNGAGLPSEAKARLADIGERLASLGAQFGQNVLADEKAYLLILDIEDLGGLPDFLVASAARISAERGHPGRYGITLSRSSIEPFLQFSNRRDLRERAFRAWSARGESDGHTDNRPIAAEMVKLRAERAALLGYESFAHFRLADTMAKTPEAALDLLQSVWTPAVQRAAEEEQALQKLAAAEGENFRIAPWDWRYYAEKQRKAEFDLDEGEIKPYLQLGKLIEAAFYAAGRLFGLSFTERFDIPLYNKGARAFEVARDGKPVALFIGDYLARPSKRSGAWMSDFRGQHKLDGAQLPIIVNVMNFAQGGEGEPSLLSFDDARTLFHEFGHGLHGMLSDVTYPTLSGTNVARDFVEFPSQLYEHWLEQPEILRRFALHYETGEPMPEALIEKLVAARKFNQGFATLEYAASALVDLSLHLNATPEDLDVVALEQKELARIGMPEAIAMRHRTPHFQHIFSGESYSAGYYSYLWSEILDADGFEAFHETGDIFHTETARRLHDFVYAAGGSRDYEDAYAGFRGRAPSPQALLRKRGLDSAAAAS
ncbi:Peptidyl-dipeptidase Dcp [Methylocella silvestris BL2]|uniref:Peptidyl-dipeptidase Dcp n=1 Tax=Methylocella silvestris (strain DSM 15510 / CIP 108128 / LMG 27833 / NCIMB 13906 / BL2) TaxID=395965 RepID=B8EJ79_METSB|nr:M3 family metallopeptidase [Methylocella silvestris]ACK52571.1 Peptidyl-dipeptidase Dcp [Methylocella silvestris BL2]